MQLIKSCIHGFRSFWRSDNKLLLNKQFVATLLLQPLLQQPPINTTHRALLGPLGDTTIHVHSMELIHYHSNFSPSDTLARRDYQTYTYDTKHHNLTILHHSLWKTKIYVVQIFFQWNVSIIVRCVLSLLYHSLVKIVSTFTSLDDSGLGLRGSTNIELRTQR